jgi:hypothetical protein
LSSICDEAKEIVIERECDSYAVILYYSFDRLPTQKGLRIKCECLASSTSFAHRAGIGSMGSYNAGPRLFLRRRRWWRVVQREEINDIAKK